MTPVNCCTLEEIGIMRMSSIPMGPQLSQHKPFLESSRMFLTCRLLSERIYTGDQRPTEIRVVCSRRYIYGSVKHPFIVLYRGNLYACITPLKAG